MSNVQDKSNLQKLWDLSATKWRDIDFWINNAGQNTPNRYVWETGENYTDNNYKRIFNILADRPETVAAFFVPKMISNSKNGKQIAWLTKGKTTLRFMKAPFSKRKLL